MTGQLSEADVITVCSACMQASCWNGISYCNNAYYADMTTRTVAQLRQLGREHPTYWQRQRS